MAGRRVVERAEQCVAELLVEAARLEAVGVEPDAAAAAPRGLRFGLTDQARAEPAAAQRLGQPEQLDEQPAVVRGTGQPAQRLPGRRVLDEHGERPEAARAGD